MCILWDAQGGGWNQDTYIELCNTQCNTQCVLKESWSKMSGFRNPLRITSLTGLALKLDVLDVHICTIVLLLYYICMSFFEFRHLWLKKNFPAFSQPNFNESPARVFKVGRNTFKVFAIVKCSYTKYFIMIYLKLHWQIKT